MVFMAEASSNPPEYYLKLEGVPTFDKFKNEWMNKCFEEMHYLPSYHMDKYKLMNE